MLRGLVALFAATHVSVHGNMDPTYLGVDEGVVDNSLLQQTQITVEDRHEQTVDTKGIKMHDALHEFIAMTLFVIIGCGSACGVAKTEGWILQVSLTFGFAITALAAATGGQINCAVTLGLVITGKLGVAQAGLNVVAQLAGSLLGAFILSQIYSQLSDRTGGLGSNKVAEADAKGGFTQVQALIGETLMTFLLMFTVLHTAVIANQVTATIAIGFAVFLAHSVLIPIDGCSINPTRSFGPAVIAYITQRDTTVFKDAWVFLVGPCLGASLAAGMVLMGGELK